MTRQELIKLIRDYLGPYYRYEKVNKNIVELVNLGLTYDEIGKILTYWYDIKQNDPALSNGGIRIVSYVQKEALDYFEEKEDTKKKIDAIPEYNPNDMETVSFNVARTTIKKPKTVKIFDLS